MRDNPGTAKARLVKTVVSWQVYDLSEFMDRHPGGPTTILAWAGKDASKFFNDIHKGVKTLGPEMRQNVAECKQRQPLVSQVVSCCWLGCMSRMFSPRIDAYLRPEAFLGDLGVDENLMSDEFWHTLREARP